MSCSTASDHQQIILYKHPFQPDISVPISREGFLNLQDFRDVFSAQISSPSENLILKLSPSTRKVSLIDPKASDLKPCQHVFMDVIWHQNNTLYLRELASPSFSGKKAFELFFKLKDLLHAPAVAWVDDAIVFPCCSLGLSINLRVIEVLKRGESWYENQGANRYQPSALKSCFEEDIEKGYKKSLESRGFCKTQAEPGHEAPAAKIRQLSMAPRDFRESLSTSPLMDYDHFRSNWLWWFDQSRISIQAYGAATEFLHALTIDELCRDTAPCESTFQIKKVIMDAVALFPENGMLCTTLGELEQMLEQYNKNNHTPNSPQHQLILDFQREVLFPPGKPLFLMVINQLDPFTPTPLMAAQAGLMLYLLRRAEGSNNSVHIVESLIGNHPDCSSPESLFSEDRKKQAVQEQLEEWEEWSKDGPSTCKFWTNVSPAQRELESSDDLINFKEGFGTALQKALNWVGNLTLSQFDGFVPGFFSRCFPDKELDFSSTIKQLLDLDALRGEKELFIHHLLKASAALFSQSAAALLNQYKQSPATFSPNYVYMLFFLANHIVNGFELFGIVSP